MGASHSLLVLAVLVLLLLLRDGVGGTFLLLVYDEARVALLGVPFEAGEDGQVELVVGLGEHVSRGVPRRQATRGAGSTKRRWVLQV